MPWNKKIIALKTFPERVRDHFRDSLVSFFGELPSRDQLLNTETFLRLMEHDWSLFAFIQDRPELRPLQHGRTFIDYAQEHRATTQALRELNIYRAYRFKNIENAQGVIRNRTHGTSGRPAVFISTPRHFWAPLREHQHSIHDLFSHGFAPIVHEIDSVRDVFSALRETHLNCWTPFSIISAEGEPSAMNFKHGRTDPEHQLSLLNRQSFELLRQLKKDRPLQKAIKGRMIALSSCRTALGGTKARDNMVGWFSQAFPDCTIYGPTERVQGLKLIYGAHGIENVIFSCGEAHTVMVPPRKRSFLFRSLD